MRFVGTQSLEMSRVFRVFFSRLPSRVARLGHGEKLLGGVSFTPETDHDVLLYVDDLAAILRL